MGGRCAARRALPWICLAALLAGLAAAPNAATGAISGVTGLVADLITTSTSAQTASANLVEDPQFDLGTSGFFGQDASSVVVQTADAPLEGPHSLHVGINGYGNNVWWSYSFSGGRASALTVGAHLRSDVASSSQLQFCAMVYYADGTTDLSCTAVSGAAGDKGTVNAALTLDSTKPLDSANIRLVQEGSAPVSFTIDAATAYLDVVEAPPAGGGDTGGGSGGSGGTGGGSSPSCAGTSPTSVYPGFAYHLPTSRPFISLNDYTQGGSNTTAAQRLIAGADQTLAGNPPYLYTAKHMVLAYRLTGQLQYLQSAIAMEEQVVTEAEAAIAAGDAPAIAGDSYLDIGNYIEDLALTYDNGFDRLTSDERQRWSAFAEQSLFNLWHPDDATWGGVAHPWTGWAVCDPGNNYHFSFLRATMLWALASQNTAWFDFLQTQKFGPLLDYYAALPGGGTREGTGYGTALNNLFGDYLYWRSSTGEDLANITAHPRETIDYWVHATVPTLDRFAPIADLSRSSIPDIYDYQENLVHEAVVLSAGTPQARRGTWWLQNNSVNGVQNEFNLPGDLLPYPDAPEAPSDLMYHATGAGVLFARTSWNSDASWIAFVAGKYDQSHAHQEQGSFTFFKNDWLSVTQNIWSHSGIHQDVDVNNVIRFQRADGTVIPQNQSDTVASTMTPSTSNGVTIVTADLANAYSANRDKILGWTRTLELNGDTLRVTDACTVAAGVQPIFQLQVPSLPAAQTDGTIQAGNLNIVLLQPATFTVVAMDPSEFQRGYRIDFTSPAGCSFSMDLRAGSGSTSTPPLPPPPPPPPPSSTPTPADGSADPVEPVWNEQGASATRIKSPAPHMHFTAGAPFRILADALDQNAWVCPPGHPPYVCPGTEERFFVDGQFVGAVPPSPDDFNLWELRLPNGLAEGDHVLAVSYVPYNPSTGGGGTPIYGLVPVTIHVDPAPAHGGTITLTQDLVLSGTANLDWTDKTIVGNGFTVSAAPGYAGSVIIQNSMVTGLGSFSIAGMNVTTSGSVSIQDSIFEATGAVRFSVQGTAPVTVRNNELRANNLITYVADDPSVPVMVELDGNTSGAKVVQGNRLGAGMLRISGDGWRIGGLAAGEGNIFIGVRAVLDLNNSSNDTVQGNYLHHDYHGGFSQGFNLLLDGNSGNELVEHNVIRGSSWPIQSFGGEFRYNLVVDSGHNFWRSAVDNALIHHNVFMNASGPNTGYDGALMVYGGESGLNIYNNTFDVGGNVGDFDAPAFNIGTNSVFQSIRNNLFTGFADVSSQYGRAFVSAPGGTVTTPRVTAADYNAFYNPLAPGSVRYLPGIVANTPGLHDVQANPQLSGQPEIPYAISEGCIWTDNCTTAQVLAHYRGIYRPAAGSPLIGAGDPGDGPGTAIGAVGPDDSNPADLFGRFLESAPGGSTGSGGGSGSDGGGADTTAPTVAVSAPSNGSTVSNTVTIIATASDNVGVAGTRIVVDGAQVGNELTAAPYSVAWDTTTASNGSHVITAVARDAAGNTTTSAAVTVMVSNTVAAPGGLVAAYGFEEGAGTTTADASGNNLAGTVSNATWTTGKFGKALSFAGQFGSWVTVPDANALDLTTGMTISAWVKPTSALPMWPSVINKERPGELTYALYANSADSSQPNVDYTSGGSEVNLNGGSALPLNTWTHLAGTFDGATLRLFVNGQLVGSLPTTAPIDVTGGVLRIGGDSVWSGEYFPGVIDEVRIYNRALSQAEIQADMNTPVVSTTGGVDVTAPTVAVAAPANGSIVSGTVAIAATATDDVGVAAVRVLVDGVQVGTELTAAPYSVAWATTTASSGNHVITAVARDAAGNSSTSAAVTVTVSNTAGAPKGLVAAYGFEEGAGTTTADASGNNLTGTISNATWTDGRFGKALRFSGQRGSWVTVPDANPLDLRTGMTVSVWVKPTSPMPAWPAVVVKERKGGLTYGIYANSDTNMPNVDYTSNGSEVNLSGTSSVPLNTWTHLAGTFDGTTLRFYVNGQLASSLLTPVPIDVTSGRLRIGGDSVWSGDYFPGVIDEVRIYNRALSQEEIQADMAAPIVGTSQPEER